MNAIGQARMGKRLGMRCNRCSVMRWFEPDAAGLYRAGVTPVPAGALAVFMAPSGEQVFVLDPKEPRS